MSDVLRDPGLQRAARMELEGTAGANAPSVSSDPDAVGAALEGALALGGGHGNEVGRQRAAVRELDEQVAAESRVNRGMAALLCERLDSSRRWVLHGSGGAEVFGGGSGAPAAAPRWA